MILTIKPDELISDFYDDSFRKFYRQLRTGVFWLQTCSQPYSCGLIINDLQNLLCKHFGSVIEHETEHRRQLRNLLNLVKDISRSKNQKMTIFIWKIDFPEQLIYEAFIRGNDVCINKKDLLRQSFHLRNCRKDSK